MDSDSVGKPYIGLGTSKQPGSYIQTLIVAYFPFIIGAHFYTLLAIMTAENFLFINLAVVNHVENVHIFVGILLISNVFNATLWQLGRICCFINFMVSCSFSFVA